MTGWEFPQPKHQHGGCNSLSLLVRRVLGARWRSNQMAVCWHIYIWYNIYIPSDVLGCSIVFIWLLLFVARLPCFNRIQPWLGPDFRDSETLATQKWCKGKRSSWEKCQHCLAHHLVSQGHDFFPWLVGWSHTFAGGSLGANTGLIREWRDGMEPRKLTNG